MKGRTDIVKLLLEAGTGIAADNEVRANFHDFQRKAADFSQKNTK